MDNWASEIHETHKKVSVFLKREEPVICAKQLDDFEETNSMEEKLQLQGGYKFNPGVLRDHFYY